MWIKSQDGEMMLFTDVIVVKKIDDNYYYIEGKDGIILGKYDDYDIAMQTLKDIENCIFSRRQIYEMK